MVKFLKHNAHTPRTYLSVVNLAGQKFPQASKERPDTQLFGDGTFEGVALSGGLHAYFSQKGIEQKVDLMEQCQDSKKNFDLANLILIR